MVWRGLAVGVLISAPMGPVGILCIQRTLDKGSKAGFYTGIGAALSDLFYCLLTGFFLSFIEDFLNENQNIIQLFGSIVLIGFSVYLFKKNPSSTLRKPLPQNVSIKKNILGGFLFTFSNPLIIFLIIGLFARFNFTAPEIKGGYYAIGYIFIIAGALGWWYAVTYLIDKVRARFNMRSMKLMNIGIGIVILAFACVGIVTSIIGLTSVNAGARKYVPVKLAPPAMSEDSIWTSYSNPSAADKEILLYTSDSEINRDASPDNFILDFKLSNLSCGFRNKYSYTDADGEVHKVSNPPWGLVMRDISGKELILQFGYTEHSSTILSSQTALNVDASLSGGYSCNRVVESGISTTDKPNHFRISYSPASGLQLRAGNRTLCQPINFEFNGPDKMENEAFGPLNRIYLLLTPASSVRIGGEHLRVESKPGSRRARLTDFQIAERLKSPEDDIEGRWKLLDYTIDEEFLRLGGDYEIAILKSNVEKGERESYQIIYIDGGKILGKEWKPGMLKGTLKATAHRNIFDTGWRDAEGIDVPVTVKAQLTEDDILSFNFPDQNTVLRFARIEN